MKRVPLSMQRAGEQAHVVVRRLVRTGILPHPSKVWCIDFCGRKAKHYDHYVGYEHKDVVHPVCQSCHFKREGLRGSKRRNPCPRNHKPNWVLVDRPDRRVIGGATRQRICLTCYPGTRGVVA